MRADELAGSGSRRLSRSALTALVALFYKNRQYQNAQSADWRPFLAILAGVLLAVVLDRITEYFTSTHFSPVKETSKASKTGAATQYSCRLLASAMNPACMRCWRSAARILAAWGIYHGEPSGTRITAILYGVSLTGIGMLTLTGNTISMDAFGPISDNANGIGEMSGLEKEARDVMDDLDATGNTTKAITKGVASDRRSSRPWRYTAPSSPTSTSHRSRPTQGTAGSDQRRRSAGVHRPIDRRLIAVPFFRIDHSRGRTGRFADRQ